MTSLATIRNPFRDSIVSDPWKSLAADVPTIHQLAFTRCCEAIAAVRAQHQTTGVLVHGEAGSGKTHLLARLHAQLVHEAEADGPGGLEEAVFISAQLQTSAKMIWRHLRRRLASDLLRRADHTVTQFERLLLHQLTKNNLIAGAGVAWLEQARKEAHGAEKLAEALNELFDRIDARGQIGYKLRQVIAALLLKKPFSEASAWLRGESLPKPALQKLGIDSSASSDEEAGEAEEQDDQDSQVVFGLCSLATAELPLVFCFDQVEALQTAVDDRAGLVAFGQMVCDLHASTQHLLLISCIQSAFYGQLGQAVRQADFARIRAFAEVALNPLTRAEALQLVKARLDSLPELRQLRAQQVNPLWPLQESEISTVFTATGCTARRLLAHCADLYEAHRQPQAGGLVLPPPVPVSQFLDQELEKRRRKALEESEPAQTDEIIKHGLPAAIHLAGKDWRQQEPTSQEVDALFAGPQGNVAVSVCNSRHWPSLVKKLARLNAQMDKQPMDKLVLLRDGRLPIGATAVKTRFLREELLKKGARWVEPSVEALAALNALRRLLADAQAGDLANRGETVALQTVQQWLAANIATELKDLLEEVLPTGSDPQPIPVNDWSLYEDIAELLQRQHVVSVGGAAARLERTEAEVAECAQQHAQQLGVLGEPPVVLFRLVSAGLAA